MKTGIDVRTSSGTYSVDIGDGILETRLPEVLQNTDYDRVVLFIDENVHQYHHSQVEAILNKLDVKTETLIIPEGEASKSVQFWSKAMDFLLTKRVNRKTPLLAIGGGVTGDLAGFAAATALRGLPLIQIPTTLLAMVDSSVGGKTGINHTMGKNLIGSFYQPQAVIADTLLLKSLPFREWINGLSEILKYGAIRDASILEDSEIFLEHKPEQFDQNTLGVLIKKCIQVKADIVKEDEFESGVRAFLNFGHTFAHALEKACDYHSMSHGEAVFLGMLAADELSNLLGAKLNQNDIKKFRPLYQFRTSKETLSLNDLMNYMKSDKKRMGHDLRFVLLNSRQHPYLKTVTDKDIVRNAWQIALNEL